MADVVARLVGERLVLSINNLSLTQDTSGAWVFPSAITLPSPPVDNSVLIVALGNSLTDGPNDTTAWPDMLRASLSDDYTVINEGYSGQTTQYLTTRVAEASFQEYATRTYGRKIAVVWEARNDMVVNASTPTVAVDNLQTLCNAVKAQGYTVYVATTSADGGGNPNFTPALRNEVNAAIIARWSTFADGLIDLGADARLSNPADTAYYSADLLHFVNGGNQVVADLVQATLAPDALPSGFAFNPTDATAAGFTLYADNRLVSKTGADGWTSARADAAVVPDLSYFELRSTHQPLTANSFYAIGLASAEWAGQGIYLGGAPTSVGFLGTGATFGNGITSTDAFTGFSYNATSNPTEGLVLQLAYNRLTGKMWVGNNGAFQGDPIAGTGHAASVTPGTVLYPAITLQSTNSGDFVLQTTSGKFTYAPPPGYAPAAGGEVDTVVKWDQGQAERHFYSISTDGLTLSKTTDAAWRTVRARIPKTTGKWSFEVECLVGGTSDFFKVGLADYAFNGLNTFLGGAAKSLGFDNGGGAANGFTGSGGLISVPPVAGDCYRIDVDFDAGKVWITDEAGVPVGDPAAGTGAPFTFTPGVALFPAVSIYDNQAGTWKLHATPASMTYALPSGFSAWGG